MRRWPPSWKRPTRCRRDASCSSCPTASRTSPATRWGCNHVPPARPSTTCCRHGRRSVSTATRTGRSRGCPITRRCVRAWPRWSAPRPGEAVVMNSLTVNLHLMLGSFYRPTAERYQIVIETDVFPSDRYAVMGVARASGFDPVVLPADDVIGFLDREGASVAVVLLSAIDFRTGALLDIPGITDAAHRAGALMGWDLAHAAGNVPLADARLGRRLRRVVPLQVRQRRAGCRRRVLRPRAPRQRSRRVAAGGLVGTRPGVTLRHAVRTSTRCRAPRGGSVSNPPILAMAPVRVSLALFAEVGMDALRARSVRLTGFLERLLDVVASRRPVELITPRDPDRRGAQLSVPRRRRRCRRPRLVRSVPGPCRRPSTQRHPARAGTALQHLRRLLARRLSPGRGPRLIPSECWTCIGVLDA